MAKKRSAWKSTIISLILGLCCLWSADASGQTAAGFIPVNRLGVSYQRAFGIDVGFGSYNVLFGRSKESFFDVSIGAEAIFANPFVLLPKLNTDIGTSFGRGYMTLGGGVDIARPTDFSQSCWMVTPKAGVTTGSLIRLYYGYNWMENRDIFPKIGRHRISLEMNIAAFHDFKIGF
ncbi:hypothetical protein [Parapedobacter tibetensis]|uniref:hypothetical protein n=1 Tax=Parapedobacter tibetensis TaxID=2972951 RepID=UPI00214D4B33|nr:hypothetical protein [Parapedobacter tibetensis]